MKESRVPGGRVTLGFMMLAFGALVVGILAIADGPPTADTSSDEVLPGVLGFPKGLKERLRSTYEAKGPSYEPRASHFRGDGQALYVNRLILEKSPYLLQHAHNPVNWYPWGEEAFSRAKAENKPVLLSIGYSTCHWCHVMEKESFEDEEIARFMNEHYIAIKVDRERRPDVDAVYMAAVTAMTGRGGWPMTVWLTPERKPYYGGTYFPPRDGDRGDRMGFLTHLRQLHEVYEERAAEVATRADEITNNLRLRLAPSPAATSEDHLLEAADRAFGSFAGSFDEVHGGFSPPPKFPRSVTLEFLLRYSHRTGIPKALEMVTKTLEAMAKGGMYDHVGGGFHRYSTDAKWLVPHFEKMLYDNALLTVAYLEAYQLTGHDDFKRVVHEVLRYVARDMTAPLGAFYSATDADSDGEEGKFFAWTPQQIEAVLGPERAVRFNTFYGVKPSGNFEHGTSLLHVAAELEVLAKEFGMNANALEVELATAREELYNARAQRVPPLKDEKILVSWNGLMISAFARAALVLAEPAYAQQAAKAADFLLGHLRDGRRLRRSWFDGQSGGTGYLDDYAFLAQGLLDLYEVTSEPRWLREAISLHDVLEQRFGDATGGGFFTTSDDAEGLLAREKPDYDGAEPSGNSVAILNLLRLSVLTTDDGYRALAEEAFSAFGQVLSRRPTAVPKMLTAVEFRLDTPKEIVIVKPRPDVSAEGMLAKLRTTYLPNHVLVVVAEGDDLTEQKKLIPLLEGRIAVHGEVTAYVCENRVCDLPTRDPEVFARQLQKRAS